MIKVSFKIRKHSIFCDSCEKTFNNIPTYRIDTEQSILYLCESCGLTLNNNIVRNNNDFYE